MTQATRFLLTFGSIVLCFIGFHHWETLAESRITTYLKQEGHFRITLEENAILFWDRNQLIGRYEHSPQLPKPHFASLSTSSGVRLTRGFPMEKNLPGESKDHPHHRGAWFCHGDVIPDTPIQTIKLPHVEGIDFWSEGMGRGKIICTKRSIPQNWHHGVGIATFNEWQGPDQSVLLKEKRCLGITHVADGTLLVWEISLSSPKGKVQFGDTKEGSLGIRINDRLNEKNGGIIRTSEGEGEKACWGQETAWCDYQGTIEGQTVGIAILDDPANVIRACWHTRSYGLHAANPFGRKKSGFPARKDQTKLAEIPEGEQLALRYAMLLHHEPISVQQLDQLAKTWTNLPKCADLFKDD